MIALTSVLSVAGTGVWVHKIYADEAKAKDAAREKAVTLNDVMAKLRTIESEMKDQTQALNQKIKSLEYQNVKLAEYLTRERSRSARVELAAARVPSRVPASPQTTLSVPLEFETRVCHHIGIGHSGKIGLDADLGGEAETEIGAEAFGDGIDGKLKGGLGLKAGFEAGGESNFEVERCLTLSQFKPFGDTAPTVDVSGFVTALQTGVPTMATKLVGAFSKFPQLGTTVATNAIDALNDLNLSLSPQNVLQAIDNPSNALAPVSSLFTSLPLPGNVGSFLQDPSTFFPKPADLNVDPVTLCSNFNGTGVISTFCGKLPSTVADLNKIDQTIASFTNVQGDLTALKMGVTNLCGSVNNTVSNLNHTNITIPQIASFQLPNGVSLNTTKFSILPIPIVTGVGLSFETKGIGPATISNPIQLPTVPCQTF